VRAWHTQRPAPVGGAAGEVAPLAAPTEPAKRRRRAPVTLLPWEYLFKPFNDRVFPDLFNAIWIFSLVGIAAVVIVYNVRTRQLRRHPPYLDLYEWLLWTSITLFFLLLVYAIFHFDFIFTVVTVPIGLGVLAWVRFVRFPPELAGYQQQLAKARFYSKQKFAHPESTIRPKRARRRRR
jgi:hypothetical protein